MTFYREPVSRRVFLVFNYIFLTVTAVVCLFPFLHILALSFSSTIAVDSNSVLVWPVEFQLDTYKFIIDDIKFYTSFAITVERTLLGIVVDMFLTVLAAYPLSMSAKKFRARQFWVWFFLIPMLFGGGLIPGYLVVYYTGLMDTIWALIIPGAVPIFNVILLQNFMKELPNEISESAFIDGAGYWTVLFRIILPLSKPVLATLILFVAVGHWNAWFDGMIYMNNSDHYPLQTYLRTIVVQIDLSTITDLSAVKDICQKNAKAAQIILAMVPILCVYPFLQKYFTKGIVMGSVKG